MDEVKVSCLCITEGRPAFMPWLLWCYDNQRWPNRELVIVDSSPEPFQAPGRDDIRVIAARPGARVPKKRNQALQAACGDIVTWFDDDDWQHPHKLCWLVEALAGGAPYAGSCQGWFVDLDALNCTRYRNKAQRPIFNSAGFRRQVAQTIRFRENLRKASDTRWMQEVAGRFRDQALTLDRPDMFFWLCHQENLSNPARRRNFAQPIEVLKTMIGKEAWGDTGRALEELKMRLETAKNDSQDSIEKTASKTVITVRDSSAGTVKEAIADASEASETPVSVMIKATVLDVPYLDIMVRHMIAQARYPFSERVIVVDRYPALTGKYRRRTRSSLDELIQILDHLQADGIIDRVCEVDMSDSTIRRISKRYWRNGHHNVPTHATTGGPIYATLFGMESMSTDHVLQMDADVFFYTGSDSWVRQALTFMDYDPSLWLMMTHPGPPAGPPGQSLGRRNASRASWDQELGIWRYHNATTRYFLCDRRKLYHRLRPLFQRGGCAPLERCISATLERERAFRGTLGDLETWHLHAWHHGSPFPQWAPALAAAVEAGHFPALQRGEYDLRLDRDASRREWQALLKKLDPTGPAAVPLGSSKNVSVPVRKTGDRKRVKKNRARTAPRRMKKNQAPVIFRPPDIAAKDRSATAPISVIIPIRDRAGQRVLNTLRGLNWQSAGRPAQVFVVSQGSQPEIDRELQEICSQESVTLVKLGEPSQPWNKSLALNTGIRATPPETPNIMTMDADMILAPDFLAVVLERLVRDPPALVLCRISDLPRHVSLPATGDELYKTFDKLHTQTRLRKRFGSGGIQAAQRSFFFDIRGYDEDLLWWGAMDGDILNRAQLMDLQHEWIEDRTAMLHQFHPRKHRILKKRDEIVEAKRYWRRNHQIVRARAHKAVRNPDSWGQPSLER